jgi:hypothetical protein
MVQRTPSQIVDLVHRWMERNPRLNSIQFVKWKISQYVKPELVEPLLNKMLELQIIVLSPNPDYPGPGDQID